MDELLNYYAEHGVVQEKHQANWNRNKTLIDLLHIPSEYEEKIEVNWNIPFTPSRSKILGYMIEKGLRNLISDIEDF